MLAPVIRPTRIALCIATAMAAPAAVARAGETACWFENGVVIAPASVLGVAGDYLIDTATPDTQLHETRAQGEGLTETGFSGEVRLAEERLAGQAVKVVDLDMRLGALPTPVMGVIGADVLRGFVVDVIFSPCRLRLSRPGHAPRFGRAGRLPLSWAAGRPTVIAQVSDGARTLTEAFAVSTGADRPVRISDALASVSGAPEPRELYPDGAARPHLGSLSFADEVIQQLPSGLEADQGTAGTIGPPVLARYRLRFDFPRGELLIGRP